MKLDPQTYAEAQAQWEGRLPTGKAAEAIYEKAEAEGHLIYAVCLSDDPEDEAWVMMCTCGDSSGFADGQPSEIAEANLMSFVEARWWARGHRSDQGLGWQLILWRQTRERFLSQCYHGEGHCVARVPEDVDQFVEVGLEDYAGSWAAVCSCVSDMDEDEIAPFDPRFGAVFATLEEVVVWQIEHRLQHGLDPQEIVPFVWETVDPPRNEGVDE